MGLLSDWTGGLIKPSRRHRKKHRQQDLSIFGLDKPAKPKHRKTRRR